MDIQRAKEEIKRAVQAYLATDDIGRPLIPPVRQRPILLMGPPGVGKTQIMEQIAQECDIALVAYTITHHTRQSAVGLPFIRERNYGGKTRSVTEYTMSEIIASVYAAMERTGKQHGILFIDEINCVSETLAPTMLQFLQCKTFGNQAVPEGWVIVAAGNPPEYNKSVREFDLVTLDRVRRIDIEPKLSVWQDYARAHRLHPAVTAYLELRPQHFYKIENDVDGVQFVTARGWEDLSAYLQAADKLNLPRDEGVIGQYLRHPEVARDFAAYWALYRKYHEDYGVEDILQGKPYDTVVARAISAPCNFLMNKSFVFKAKSSRQSFLRYIVLAVGLLLVSAVGVELLVTLLGFAPALASLVKLVVDTLLYLVSYRIQNRWVFPPEEKEAVQA